MISGALSSTRPRGLDIESDAGGGIGMDLEQFDGFPSSCHLTEVENDRRDHPARGFELNCADFGFRRGTEVTRYSHLRHVDVCWRVGPPNGRDENDATEAALAVSEREAC